MAKQIKYLDYEGLKALYGVVDGKITTAVTDAKGELKGTVTTEYDTLGKLEDKIKSEASRATSAETALDGRLDALESGDNSVGAQITAAVDGLKNGASEGYDTLKGLEDKIKEEATRAKGAEQANADAIAAMDLTDSAVDGEFITSVSQSDGKVAIVRGKVASDKVTAVAVSGGADTVAINGTTVDAQIKSLGKTLKTVEGNAAKYKVVKLSAEDLKGLSDSDNVREAYKVVSWTGDEATAHPTQVGETIKIYKDAALLSVTPEDGGAGENTVIKFTYSLANGSQKDVSVDLGKAIFESEMGNGMQVVDHKIAIKLDAANENAFLTVGENGLKLSGVQDAIDTAKAAATTKVAKAADAAHLTVTKGETAADGSVTYTIGESNIASADALTTETNRAKGAEDKIEASVGLATDGSFTAPTGKNYINGATTVMGAVEKLDEQAKANANKIAGMSVDEVNQTVTIDSKGLQFVAFTAKEIVDAANSAAGK